MSTEIEEHLSVVQPEDPIAESSKKPKRSYTREFLLSLSELNVCKKLPDGFDVSLLSEFDDASHGTQDRPQIPGSSLLRGFGRTDSKYPPPGRGDSGNYSRGLHRWDSRSSGRSDTDSDSEPGRRYGSQARRPGHSPEHDGLLGSGSFPRPSGYAAGASVPRFRPNGNFHLNKSNEPYHPPRPYKAVPHSRRETNDSYNDETFGSTDCTNEDRVEEEKKRRAEFELMRKEVQKSLQEKQKPNSGKPEDPFSDIVGLLGNHSDGKISSDVDKVVRQAPQEDSSKLPVSSQAPPSRPLVPPGFVSSVVDKSLTAKSLVHAEQLEVRKSELQDSHQDMKSINQERVSTELQHETSSSAFKAEKVLNLSSVLQGTDQVKVSSLPDVNEVLENGDIVGLDSEVTTNKILGEPRRSTSILDKLFGNALTPSTGTTSDFVEGHDAKADDIGSPNTLQSKFARWFLEEDKKSLGDTSLEKPNELLSLIVGGEKGASDASDVATMGPILTLEKTSSTAEIPESFANSNVPEPKPAVLTCEDLEQSILSEISGSSSNSQPRQHNLDVKAGNPGAEVDNLASQHLLSLLQRGIGSTDVSSISVVEEKSLDRPSDHEVGKIGVIDGSISNDYPEESNNSSSKTLTLEALFGTAFMKELHSAQSNPRTDVSESPFLDGALFSSAMNETGNGKGSGSFLELNDGVSKLDEVGSWLGFHNPGKEVEFSNPLAADPKFGGGFDGGSEVRLPEEDSLISLSDPLNAQSSSNAPLNVIEKIAVLGANLKDDRSMIGVGQDRLLGRGPYDLVNPDILYQNIHPPQMNHGRPPFHALDSHPGHIDQHLKFMPPEAIVHRDAPPTRHQFPGNMGHPPFPHPSAGLQGFDLPPPMLQQIHMAGNVPPPPHLVRGFPGGAPMPPHPGNNPTGYIQEHNPMQGFPFGQRQPNFGGPGMAPPGPELGGGSNPPEAFQRLLEMERRANPKQMHPFPPAAHSRPMYGHELDTGFRYR